MAEDGRKVTYEEFIELKYDLALEMQKLASNVNQLAESVKDKFSNQDQRIKGIEDGQKEQSKQPDKVKWFLVVIIGIAFLGCLGAAIGINLLKYLPA